MTVMGKQNLMILKKRNYRINFKVTLDFIVKFTLTEKTYGLSISLNCFVSLYFTEFEKMALVAGGSHTGLVPDQDLLSRLSNILLFLMKLKNGLFSYLPSIGCHQLLFVIYLPLVK